MNTRPSFQQQFIYRNERLKIKNSQNIFFENFGDAPVLIGSYPLLPGKTYTINSNDGLSDDYLNISFDENGNDKKLFVHQIFDKN